MTRIQKSGRKWNVTIATLMGECLYRRSEAVRCHTKSSSLQTAWIIRMEYALLMIRIQGQATDE